MCLTTWLDRESGGLLTNDILEQLPVPAFDKIALESIAVVPRALELTYTAWDLEPFAQDCGWSGPPFRWDEERRFLLRELDAPFSTSTCHLRKTVTGAQRRARLRKT